MLWEAAQFRRRFFGEDDLPTERRKVADRGDFHPSRPIQQPNDAESQRFTC
jgi:hypothetical protein